MGFTAGKLSGLAGKSSTHGACWFILLVLTTHSLVQRARVAEVGSFSARAKIATKAFVRRVFAIFLVVDASFLHVLANLLI